MTRGKNFSTLKAKVRLFCARYNILERTSRSRAGFVPQQYALKADSVARCSFKELSFVARVASPSCMEIVCNY